MSKSKFVGIMALIVFSLSVLLIGNADAGEKFKFRIVWYIVKAERINIGDEKDHFIRIIESKGIVTNMEGKAFGDGWLSWNTGLADVNPPSGATVSGYGAWTDKDGDKIYWKWNLLNASGPNPATFYKGTGKFQGVQGKATYSLVYTADPNQFYADWEGEVELPR
jgi:hypothetical protein